MEKIGCKIDSHRNKIIPKEGLRPTLPRDFFNWLLRKDKVDKKSFL